MSKEMRSTPFPSGKLSSNHRHLDLEQRIDKIEQQITDLEARITQICKIHGELMPCQECYGLKILREKGKIP